VPKVANAESTRSPGRNAILDVYAEDTGREHRVMDMSEVGKAVTEVNNWIDSDVPIEYQRPSLAQDWARIAKITEEAGEVVEAFILMTGQNPRKESDLGFWEHREELLGELADVVACGVLAIQHFTGDWNETERVLWDKLVSLRERVPEKYQLG
jgi:NTP pyrophosphatase (non-canonical NTP hydrolase)